MKNWKSFCFCALLALHALFGQGKTSPASLELYSNQGGHNLRQLYYNEIQSATSSILLIIYGLTDPLIISGLQEQMERGVEVTVIADPAASKSLPYTLKADVELIVREGLGLMHQKILVIDHQRVLIGSSNLTSESLVVHGNIVAALNHDALANHIETHLGSGGRSMEDPWRSGPLEFWELPSQPQALERIVELIDSAKTSLKIGMFTWTHPLITDAVIRAHERGVEVLAYLDRASSKGASKKVARRLAESGIPLKVSAGYGLLHYKTCQIDDHVLLIGSLNWTLSAFGKNSDCFLVIKELEEPPKKVLNKMWKTLEWESVPF